MALELTDANFAEKVINNEGVSVVDFWATWCGPCRMIAPIIEDLSKEYGDKVVIGKLDVDSNPDVSFKFGIRNIPTILIFKNGEIVEKHVGATTKNVLEAKINAYLS